MPSRSNATAAAASTSDTGSSVTWTRISARQRDSASRIAATIRTSSRAPRNASCFMRVSYQLLEAPPPPPEKPPPPPPQPPPPPPQELPRPPPQPPPGKTIPPRRQPRRSYVRPP